MSPTLIVVITSLSTPKTPTKQTRLRLRLPPLPYHLYLATSTPFSPAATRPRKSVAVSIRKCDETTTHWALPLVTPQPTAHQPPHRNPPLAPQPLGTAVAGLCWGSRHQVSSPSPRDHNQSTTNSTRTAVAVAKHALYAHSSAYSTPTLSSHPVAPALAPPSRLIARPPSRIAACT